MPPLSGDFPALELTTILRTLYRSSPSRCDFANASPTRPADEREVEVEVNSDPPRAESRWIAPGNQRPLIGYPADGDHQPQKIEPALFRRFVVRYGDMDDGSVAVIDHHIATW